jgi:aspartyl-tRNA(Asn)/glutamyl-tRNA(Gln) amidotransferase subunit A
MTSEMTATGLAVAYRKAALSPVEVTRAILARIEATASLNAFCHVDADGALAAARASEARHACGETLGPLDGIPIGIKDLIVTRGMPTRRGSLTTPPDAPMAHDAPVVARLREAGAVLLGKTTTPEFGWKGVTDSPLTGITRNPWNQAHTPGGSSGGAAVQVAAGLGPIGIGTDGGGSIRIPASFTGVFGFKPSFGRVPAWPSSSVGTLAHTGPLTRNVADAVTAMSIISGWDARDWTSLPQQELNWGSALQGSLAGRRIAYSPDLGFAQVDPEVAALVRRAVDLMEQAGAHVEEVDPGIGAQEAAISVLWRAGCARGIARLTEAQKALLEPAYREAGEAGARFTLADWHDANDARAALGARMRVFHESFDVLITPTMRGTAFEAGQNAPRNADGSFDFGWNAFCYQFNITQQPAASLPCGLTSKGLPAGIQIIGAMHDDVGVLSVSHALEQVLGPTAFPILG